ncbi:hypothetical protein DPX16_18752 [Anabarilius grahami]|uniref:Uncharacterized protein n=1 Tax=Anabarilius grahami TaxID=495550 RepID=A0A3N0Y2K6_ANAGA|nr:hypothetical protein DPX16_18752 [Anabarilius grahami]
MTQRECSSTRSEVGSGSGSFYASQIVIGELLCSNTNPRYSTNALRSWRRRRSANTVVLAVLTPSLNGFLSPDRLALST